MRSERQNPTTVRRAVPGDEPILRDLRLQALTDAPDAFASTLERERARTAADWLRWISHGATFVFEDTEGPRGIVAGVPHDSDPSAAFLMSLWAHPEVRGTGAADALVAAVASWAEREGAAAIWLHVGERNERARRFYERNGFRLTGETIRVRDAVIEVEMRRGLG